MNAAPHFLRSVSGSDKQPNIQAASQPGLLGYWVIGLLRGKTANYNEPNPTGSLQVVSFSHIFRRWYRREKKRRNEEEEKKKNRGKEEKKKKRRDKERQKGMTAGAIHGSKGFGYVQGRCGDGWLVPGI